MVYDWFKNEQVALSKIKAETEKFYEIYNGRAVNFYKEFFSKS